MPIVQLGENYKAIEYAPYRQIIAQLREDGFVPLDVANVMRKQVKAHRISRFSPRYFLSQKIANYEDLGHVDFEKQRELSKPDSVRRVSQEFSLSRLFNRDYADWVNYWLANVIATADGIVGYNSKFKIKPNARELVEVLGATRLDSHGFLPVSLQRYNLIEAEEFPIEELERTVLRTFTMKDLKKIEGDKILLALTQGDKDLLGTYTEAAFKQRQINSRLRRDRWNPINFAYPLPEGVMKPLSVSPSWHINDSWTPLNHNATLVGVPKDTLEDRVD